MVTVLACGDVGVKRDDPATIFRGCDRVLRSADLTFAQLETTVSTRGAKVPNARLAMRAPPAMLTAAHAAGIGVMSFAGNHCLDYGYEAFFDTLEHAQQAGISLCGAGNDLQQALQPVFVHAGALRVAVIAANSILPEGYAAGKDKAGCAPLRASTVYEQVEPDQPGTPARIRTFADKGDLAALSRAVADAKRQADLVLVSIHWGIHMVPILIADYQREAARVLIEAGADAILGHHPHVLKGVEFHRGRPIFYSLGNFAIEQPHMWDPAIINTASFKNLVSLNPTWAMSAVYMLPPVTRLTGVAKLAVRQDGSIDTRFLPAWIEDDSAPQLLPAGDARFMQVADFLAKSNAEAGLNSSFSALENELILHP
jgi:poly-gamma-glutamate synthesis protein (capsule biosynthesis protein)